MALKATPLVSLAQGGMANILLGVMETGGSFRRICAIKQVAAAYAADPSFQQMFEREASICQTLQHSNLVQIFGYESIDGIPSIVMEYVHGIGLTQAAQAFRRKGAWLPEPFAISVVCEVAKGLHYLHTRRDTETRTELKLVHRDIAFDNILISQEGEVKICDFGIAKSMVASDLTRAGIIKGKLSYMSPEQVGGQPLAGSTDVYSLGVVLWEALTGQKLFQANTDVELFEQIGRGVDSATLQKRQPTMKPELLQIVSACLNKNAEARPSAADLVEALTSYLRQAWGNFSNLAIARMLTEAADVELVRMSSIVKDVLELSRIRQENQEKADRNKPAMEQAALQNAAGFGAQNSLAGREPVNIVVNLDNKAKETYTQHGLDLEQEAQSPELKKAMQRLGGKYKKGDSRLLGFEASLRVRKPVVVRRGAKVQVAQTSSMKPVMFLIFAVAAWWVWRHFVKKH